MASLREQNMKLKGITKKNQKPRSSITDPYENFWPLLNSEKSKILIDEMEKNISKENGKLKINWFTLKKLPLDVRKCWIKDLSNKHKLISPNLEIQRSILKMGINEVSRCIEKDQIACCLIAEDVANCMIAKHLLFMTASKKIPVVILPHMRSVTKQIVGFSSAALGLKSDILNIVENPLHNLYRTVVQLSKAFKSPYLKHITRTELKSVENPIKLNVTVKNYLIKKPKEGKAFIPGSTSNMQTVNDLSFIPIEKMVVEEQKSFESKKKREKKSNQIMQSTSIDLFCIDTEPLNIEDIGEFVERKTNTFREPLRYHGLKIKKIKPNPNRKLNEKLEQKN